VSLAREPIRVLHRRERLAAAIFSKFETEATLADPGIADNTNHATLTLNRICDFKFEGCELVVASDQWCQTLSTAENVACRGIEQRRQLEDFYRRRDPANGLHSERNDFHKLLSANVSILGDEDAALIRHLLHSICDMHVRAGSIVGLVDTVFYRLDDDFTGMDADTDLQARVCKPRNRILHGQSSQTTTNGMILMRSRRAENRHHAIALYLVDDTVVAMNGILHEVEHRLQTPHAQFRIAQAVNQTRGISDVRKQQCEAFAFPAFSAERPEDTLRRWFRTCRCRYQRRTALPAKAAGRSADVIADVTLDSKRRAAVFAKVVAGLVLAIASRALHAQPFRWRKPQI
jgi:hypothetical protein